MQFIRKHVAFCHKNLSFIYSVFGNSTLRTMTTDKNRTSASVDDVINDKTLFADLPRGPLDRYRKVATFDWRKFALLLDDEKSLRFRHKIWKFLQEEPIFAQSLDEMTLDEKRKLAVQRQFKLLEKHYVSLADSVLDPTVHSAYILSLIAYEPSFIIKASLSNSMFPGVLRSMGSTELTEYAEAAENGEIYGAFALTEISHGSNALGMRTTATYDAKTRQFVINTPDFEAAKCWVGNLGKTCTHAIVYAQLYTADGQHHGLNGFMVPIRDTKSLLPFAGVIVGDLGQKVGLDGVDNGFVMFDDYRIPREFLLSRTGHMSDDGRYVSPIKDNKKRIGASFGALSGGRVNICGISNTYLIKAISVAIRYSASRTQFKDENDTEEWPILEYQSQQYRLLPHLATAIVQKVFATWFSVQFAEFAKFLLGGEPVPLVGTEIHALSSAVKPVCTWAVRDAIQDCRESTGGHGYLKVAGFGDLRDDNDPNCTYEGENNVLLQQASNWLLTVRKSGYAQFKQQSPLGSARFLHEFDTIIKQKFILTTSQEAIEPHNILSALNWLVAWSLENTYERSQQLQRNGTSSFTVRNNMQVFHAQTLAIAYGQRMIFDTFLRHITALEKSPERNVLERLLSLYGANLMLRHIGSFYEGGFITGPIPSQLIKSGVLDLLAQLKNDAISVVDAIAPIDFVLNSPLGMSDGQVYKHLQSILWQTNGTFERPKWWREVTHWKHPSQQSKL